MRVSLFSGKIFALKKWRDSNGILRHLKGRLKMK